MIAAHRLGLCACICFERESAGTPRLQWSNNNDDFQANS